MRAILVQNQCSEALDEPPKIEKDKVEPTPAPKIRKINQLAYSLNILNLFDKILRQVNKENTTLKVWTKLESLYMARSLTSKIYLKGKLFGFKMNTSKSLEENLDGFNVIVIGLEEY